MLKAHAEINAVVMKEPLHRCVKQRGTERGRVLFLWVLLAGAAARPWPSWHPAVRLHVLTSMISVDIMVFCGAIDHVLFSTAHSGCASVCEGQ